MSDPIELLRISHHPERSGWCCYLVGDPNNIEGSVMYRPAKGQEPNCIHRWMQSLCFGFKWVKKPLVALEGKK